MATTETRADAFLTLRLERDLLNWYVKHAAANGISRSDLLRAALDAYRKQAT